MFISSSAPGVCSRPSRAGCQIDYPCGTTFRKLDATNNKLLSMRVRNYATFRGDACSKHSRDPSQPSGALGNQHVKPVWALGRAQNGLAASRQGLAQLQSLTIGARPESVVVWSVAPGKPQWWNPWRACQDPRPIWLNPSTGALSLQP